MNPLKLLIVEDDAPSLELMAEVFSNLQANVYAVGNSKKATDLVSMEKFDGIFVDLEMPRMTGLELAQKIRYSPWNRSTPIVMVTGNEERNVMQRGFATGATFFLQKPIDRQKLNGLFRTISGAMVENRRKSLRVPMHTDVSCTVGTRFLNGRTWNLSRGGMQIETFGLKAGDMVHASFLLPGSTTMVGVHGLVVWVKAGRQGIQFTKMSYKNEEDVRDFMIKAEN